MASNVTAVLNAYQINQRVLDRDAPQKFAFPTQGCILQDCSTSPARSLSSGYNVYSLIIVPSSAAANSFGTEYYVAETIAQLVTIFNA
jgi:ethanolamine ammonia-lyase large subunit